MKTLSKSDIGLLPPTRFPFKRFRVNKFVYLSGTNEQFDPMVCEFYYDTKSLTVHKFIIHAILPSDSKFYSTQNGFLGLNIWEYFYDNII
jgi:hypothetical protein